MKYVLMNQLLVAPLLTVLMFYCYKWRGCDFGPVLPTFHWGLFELLVYSMVEEVCFYYSHRSVTVTPIADDVEIQITFIFFLCVYTGCFIIPFSTSIFIRFIMNGKLRSVCVLFMLILLSMSSPTC